MFTQLTYPVELEKVHKKTGQTLFGIKIITKFNIYGLAAVRKNNRLGLINAKYELILPIEFDSISNYTNDGTAVVKRAVNLLYA